MISAVLLCIGTGANGDVDIGAGVESIFSDKGHTGRYCDRKQIAAMIKSCSSDRNYIIGDDDGSKR